MVNTGISIEMPAGVYARIAPRSGLAVKNRIAVGGGVIDPDYDGEVKVILFNPGKPSGEPIGDPLVSEALV